jgi:hypothetical protein
VGGVHLTEFTAIRRTAGSSSLARDAQPIGIRWFAPTASADPTDDLAGAQGASSGNLDVKKALRWLAAMTMTWLLATTILATLVARPVVGSFAFAVILNMLLPMWIVAFFAIADPNLDHPWLVPYFRARRWEHNGRRYLHLGVLRFQAYLKKYRIGVFGLRPREFRVTQDALFLEKMERETRNAEVAHGVCFLVVAGFAIDSAVMGSITGALAPADRRGVPRVSDAAPALPPPALASRPVHGPEPFLVNRSGQPSSSDRSPRSILAPARLQDRTLPFRDRFIGPSDSRSAIRRASEIVRLAWRARVRALRVRRLLENPEESRAPAPSRGGGVGQKKAPNEPNFSLPKTFRCIKLDTNWVRS